MSGAAPLQLTPFGRLILVGIGNHVVLSGSRVAVSLDALRQGASPATVGLLLALFAILPVFLSISAGRLADRIGVRRPMTVGSCGIVLGAALSFLFPGLTTLFVTALLIGASFMLFQVATQYATGEMGPPEDRVRNFGLLALGYSVSSVIGPMLAGFLIDHAGFRAVFAVLALVPVAGVVVLLSGRLPLPGPHPAHAPAPFMRAIELLLQRDLRMVFAINVMISTAWEVHTIFVPVYGNMIGLSASEIGLVLGVFATATFLVRLLMPLIARNLRDRSVLAGALFVAGAVFCAYPFAKGAPTMMVLAFCMGFGIGSTQPIVLSLLHQYTPPGRMGEAAGVRMSVVNMMAVAVPVLFGALGATIGIAPVLWAVGACLTTGGWLARREH